MREGVDFTWCIPMTSSDRPRLSEILLLVMGAYFCFSLALWAQTSDSPTVDGNQSWTSTTESHSDNVNPTRTTESHSKKGNRYSAVGLMGASNLSRMSKGNQCR